MQRKLISTAATFCLALFLAGVSTSGMAASERVAELDAKDDEEPLALDSMTCADVFALYEDATPADDKDPQDLAEAQDDTLYLVAWVHGYLSGRDGIGKGAPKLTKSGIEQVIADVAAVCEPDDSKRFLDVVDGIK